MLYYDSHLNPQQMHNTKSLVSSDENSPGASNRGAGELYDASNAMMAYVDANVSTPKAKHSNLRGGHNRQVTVVLTPETTRGGGSTIASQSFDTPSSTSSSSTDPAHSDGPRAPLKEDRQQPIVATQHPDYFEKKRAKCLKFEDEQSLAPLESRGGTLRSRASKSTIGSTNKSVRIDSSNAIAGSREHKQRTNMARADDPMQTPKKASSQSNDWIYGRQQSYTFDDVVDSPVENIPLISGFNVLVNSPDPLSKYHNQSADHNAEDVIDVSHTPCKDRVGGSEEDLDFAGRLGGVAPFKQPSASSKIERFAVPKSLTVAEMRKLEFGSDPVYDARPPPPQPKAGRSVLIAPSHLSPDDELIKSRNAGFRSKIGSNHNSNISPDSVNSVFNETMSPLRPNYSNLKKLIHGSAGSGIKSSVSDPAKVGAGDVWKPQGSDPPRSLESPKPGVSRTPDRTSSRPSRPRPGMRKKASPTSEGVSLKGSESSQESYSVVSSSLNSVNASKSQSTHAPGAMELLKSDVVAESMKKSSLSSETSEDVKDGFANPKGIIPMNLSKIIGDVDISADSNIHSSSSQVLDLSHHFESGAQSPGDSPSKPTRPSYPPKANNVRSSIMLRRRNNSSPTSKGAGKPANSMEELESRDDTCTKTGLQPCDNMDTLKITPREAAPRHEPRPCTSPESSIDKKSRGVVVHQPSRVVEMPRRKQHKSEREKFVPYLEVLAEDHAVSYERPSWLNILKDSNEKSKRNGTSLSQTIKISSVDRKTSQVSDDRVDWNDSPLRQDFSKSYGNGDSTSPLFGFECIFNRDGPGLKSFVDTHEDIQGLVDEFGNNLLLAAVFVGWERAVRFLLKRGLRLDGVNKFGRSALSYAIGMEYYEIRDLLYRKGASLTQ